MGIKKKDLLGQIEHSEQEITKIWHSYKALCEIIHEQNKAIDGLRSELATLGRAIVCIPVKHKVGRPKKVKP
jgi:hypothetical protein